MFMNIFMAFIVWWTKKRILQILWILTALSVGSFGWGFYTMATSTDISTALWGWKVSYVGVIAIPVLMLHTILYLIKNTEKIRWYILYGGYVLALFLEILNLQWLVVSDVQEVFSGAGYYIPLGYTFEHLYYGIFMVYFKIIVLYLFYLLIKTYKKSEISEYKKQLFYYGLWAMVGFIWWESCFLPTYGVHLYPYFGVLIGVYPMIILYAMLQHHLFDARYAILQTLRFVLTIVVSFSVGWAIWWFAEVVLWYSPIIHPVEISIWISTFATAIVFYRSRKISWLFLVSSLVELEKEAERFLEKPLVYNNGLDLLSDLEQFFWKWLKIHRVSIFNEPIVIDYPRCSMYFHTYRKPLILSELENEDAERNDTTLIEEVRSLGNALFPIEWGKEDTPKLLILWPKESEEGLIKEEVRIILRILPKIALALQILEFNQSLRNEVRIQTKAIAKKNRELQDAYEKLKEIDKNKDNFLAITSHELRTPMTIIKGYADLFLTGTLWQLTQEESRYMKKIYESTSSLIDLVNNILDISKIEAGRMEITLSDIHPDDVIKKCMDDFQSIYQEKNITLRLTNLLRSDIILHTDEGKLRLILTNLLSNAYKFTLPWWTVDMKVWTKDKFLHVSVTDTGIGIAKEKLKTVFDRFSQASNADYMKKSIKGTGLWLNLSKQLIEMLGGTIRATSREKKGSCFEFTLPL